MTDRAKFEEMLERLIAEDRAGAEELFHEIVVEKSREIYSSILESEDEEVEESEDEDLDESDDEDLDESDDDDLEESEDDELDEMFGLDEFEMEADPMAAMGGDATDDMMGDIGMDDEEGDMDDEEGDMDDEEGEGPEGAMADLRDALAALEAEFEKLMGNDEDDEDEEDEEDDDEEEKESFAFESDDDEEVEESEDESVEEAYKKKAKKSAAEQMREYVEKVAPAKMGDNGANAKSIVAGKNDMGGTASNIAAGGTEAGVEANKGQLKGNGVFKGTAKEDNAGNVNVPGAKGATKMASQPGHGAEKKGKPENAANKKSTIGSK